MADKLDTSAYWRQHSIETWQAFRAMRDLINEHVPMPSLEADLLEGPEMSVSCANVAKAVIKHAQDMGVQMDALRAEIERLKADRDKYAASAAAFMAYGPRE